MVPSTIRGNLASLRRRERLLTLVWGGACWLSIVIVLLILCSFVDWLIDRDRDTPEAVRLGLAFVQLAVAAVAALLFVFWPQVKLLPDTLMALWVEDKMPEFDHRLITTVQLNAPGADLGGMSKELVIVVTREAERQAETAGFAQVADHRRFGWSVAVLAPVLFVAMLPFALWPELALALVQRQAFVPGVEIPHSIRLESTSPEVWPIGETIPFRYRVKDKWDKEMVGRLRVVAAGQTSDYELEFITQDGADAIFGADVPAPAATDLRYSARLADGRTKKPSAMLLVPRPEVDMDKSKTWILLPEYCGKRPDGQRYEREQPRGVVRGIPGARVRVLAEVQKRVKSGWLVLERTQTDEEKNIVAIADVLKKIPMTIQPSYRRIRSDDPGERKTDQVVEASAMATNQDAQGNQIVTIRLKMEKGWWIHAHAGQGNDQKRNQTEVTISGAPAPLSVDVEYPAGKTDEFDGQLVNVYDGTVELKAKVQRPIGDIGSLKLQIRVHAFSEKERLPPATLTLVEASSAEAGFDLAEGLSGYRVVVEDHYGFDNTPPPRRPLFLEAEDPPQVALLRDSFGPGADFDIEGIPVPLGDKVRIPYVCHGKYGLGRAQILYRLVKKHDSDKDPVEEEKWIPLKLTEIANPDPVDNPFDPRTGVLVQTAFDQQVPFHAAPSRKPHEELGRTLGGGRYFLETKGLIDSKGNILQLKSGDQIEYSVEVYAMPREPEASIPFARSETRVSTVVSEEDFRAWRKNLQAEDARIRALEAQQRSVFERR